MNSKPTSNRLAISSLFLLIIIDSMGLSIVFPIFAPLFFHSGSMLIDPNISSFMKDVIFGLSLCVFPLFMFFGAPLLGQMSDNIGRKKALLLCLVGTAIGYWLSALGIIHSSLSELLIGRAIAGLFAGSQAIAQAAIADISTSENKAANMGMIVLAYCAGVIIGPLLSGFSSSSHVYHSFDYSTPFIISALLAVLNAALLLISFTETYKVQNKKIHLFGGVSLVFEALKLPQVRILSISFIFMMIAWSLFYQSIGWFLMQTYNSGAVQIGIFMGFMGFVSAIALTVGIRKIFGWLKMPTKVFLFCISLMVIANLIMSAVLPEYMVWLLVIPNAFGVAISYAVTLSLFSNSVDANSQGMIMGVSGSLNAVAWTITALSSGFLGYLNIRMPYLITGIAALLSLIYMLILNNRMQQTATKNNTMGASETVM